MRSLYPWPLLPPDLDARASRSLSLQLCVQEWICAFDCIAELEERTENPHALADTVQKLLLFALDSIFSAKPGTLDKLACYLNKLLANSTLTCKSPKTNETEILLDQAHDDTLAFWNTLIAWKRAYSPMSPLQGTVRQLCETLRNTLLSFFEALFPFFEEAKCDENVLFFLIERQSKINHIFQYASPRKSLEDLFRRLYPTGPTHLRTILAEGYTRRGFGEFYAQHKTVIESIEWLTEECTTISH